MTPDDSLRRPLRSFVRRAGRITTAQRRALDELWPQWGLAPVTPPLDLDAVFGRRAPRLLEIGFGDGEVLLATAQAHPHWDCLGVEVHEPGVGHCLLGIEARQLGNLRLIREDAVEVLRHWLAPASLDRVHIFFPDPWPKKRHHKRRLIQPDFLALLASRLRPGGRLHLATDWADYAEHMAAVLAASEDFEPAPADFVRPATRFQRRGERLGHAIYEFTCRRLSSPSA